MTVKDLIDVIDPHGNSTSEFIQVVYPEGDWDDYDTLCVSSKLLNSIYDKRIRTLAAMAEDIIRVDIDWGDDK